MRNLPLALLFAIAPAVPAQVFETISTETFEYPAGTPLGALAGGFGWAFEWYSGATGGNALVTAPGLDGAGLRASSAVDNGGSWRALQLDGFDVITDFGQIGKDGTAVFVSFWCQRAAGSDDDYGGLSLYIRFGGEQLFLGSPSFTQEWGLHDILSGAAPATVPGTDCDNLARLVYEITFNTGADRVRMWVDPPALYPVTPPDLDVAVSDFHFNEIRIQSGNSAAGTGFHFDGIVIDTPAFRPVLGVSNAAAGQVAHLSVRNCFPGNQVVIAYSLTGAGPTTTPLGNVSLSPPITQLAPATADQNGEVHRNVTVPAALAGRTVWTQAAEFITPGSGTLSNPLAVQVQ
ncbi:MAG: hypothetical protein EYC70_08775 [Planctomycetota bacterium]|nr:MAG: hypothetical protein EYC70_08775 [Planctomycetota bacterium]